MTMKMKLKIIPLSKSSPKWVKRQYNGVVLNVVKCTKVLANFVVVVVII